MCQDYIFIHYLHYLFINTDEKKEKQKGSFGALMTLWHLLHPVEFIHLSHHDTQDCLNHVILLMIFKIQSLLDKAAYLGICLQNAF